jgi:hypothetical protein
MKTMLKITFLFALVAVANTMFAAGNLKLNMVALKNEKAMVAISALENSNFNITITNENGQIVYYQENSDPSSLYNKVYNFSELEDGSYKIMVVSSDLTTEREFLKSHGKIKVGEERTSIEPFFGYENNLLRCSFLNFMNEDVALRFYNNDQQVFYKKIGKEFNVQQALNLSKLGKGTYEAVLTAGDKQYSYPIEIQ